jgi:hypothetical protein
MLQTERVLFHYNGHGVPRPTANGEIWVFNKSYTQYIPMSIYDLQAWVGSPAIYVFDCSAAGLIINSFRAFAEQRSQVRRKCSPSSLLHVFMVFQATNQSQEVLVKVCTTIPFCSDPSRKAGPTLPCSGMLMRFFCPYT